MKTDINALKKSKTVFHINELLFFKANEDAIVVQNILEGCNIHANLCVWKRVVVGVVFIHVLNKHLL